MRVNGLVLKYKDGTNTVLAKSSAVYPVGDLLCRIFQGETLYNISQIVRGCINACPMRDNSLTQDEIEEAEHYILETLRYEDFYPAYKLAQGSFIRCMEEYRVLDSNTAEMLLVQEVRRAMTDERLFCDIGFTTVGEYLRLCYNNYLTDLINGIEIFISTSAVWSGTATDKEQILYKILCEALIDHSSVPGIVMNTAYDSYTETFEHHYIISSFAAMAFFEFSHLAESSIKIMRCQNPECRKFFTAKRTSAKYCGFSAPQCPSRACNDYYPQYVHREKMRVDVLDRLIKNAKGRLYNAKRRNPEQESEIKNQLSDLTIFAPNKKEQVLNGTLSMTEFREWLDSHKHKKGYYKNE